MSAMPMEGFLSTKVLSTSSLALIVSVALAAWAVYGAFWRLYLSPVAHVPGPWFAKLTFWNEFYYDVVQGGRYTWKIGDYHAKYGPIIRINPYEVHIMDSEFLDELFVGSSKRKTNKWYWSMRMFGQYDESVFDTLDHDKHRMRREPWNPYFSKQSVARLQPRLIQTIVNNFCDRLAEHRDAGKSVVMKYAYACLTVDIISEYSFPSGYNFVGQKNFDRAHYDSMMALSWMSHLLKQFGWLYPLLRSFPSWVTKYTSTDAYLMLQVKQHLKGQIDEIASRKKNQAMVYDYKEITARPSMLEAFLDSSLPEREKDLNRITAEAQSAIAAGTLTSSHCLKHATFHILANPHIHSRLMDELERIIPDISDPPELQQLDNVDYLVAIFWESLRNFHGTSHRLQRIFPDHVLRYKDVAIPPGNPVSMTSVHVHNDAAIFPEPYEFRPERWLPLATEGQRLQRYMQAFGRGSRKCVGMELGRAEVLTALANIFRRFGREMKLVDTERVRDIDIKHDLVNPLPSRESNGLLVSFGEQLSIS